MTFEKYMKNEHTGRDNAIKSKALESIFHCKGIYDEADYLLV